MVNFSVAPLRMATILGFLMSGVGLVGTVWTVAEALFSKTPRGWASLAVSVLLLSGVQLVVLGLLGEYLGRVYLTVNGKPQWSQGKSRSTTLFPRTAMPWAARKLDSESSDADAVLPPYYAALFAAIAWGLPASCCSSRADRSGDVVGQFFSPFTLAAFAVYAVSAMLYAVSLRKLPLSVAFPSVALSYIAVAIFSHLLWHEELGWPRIAA